MSPKNGLKLLNVINHLNAGGHVTHIHSSQMMNEMQQKNS